MKILFLDFDGVITTPESRWKIDRLLQEYNNRFNKKETCADE